MPTFSNARAVLAVLATAFFVSVSAPGQSHAAFDIAAHMQDEFHDFGFLDKDVPDREMPLLPTNHDLREEAQDSIVFIRIPEPEDHTKLRIIVPKRPPPPPPIDPWPEDEIERLLAEVTIRSR